jgi:hypothetical protein
MAAADIDDDAAHDAEGLRARYNSGQQAGRQQALSMDLLASPR